MATKKLRVPTEIYQIKITLRGVTPAVWRRVLVSADMTLGGLHEVLQIAMGWSNYHMHDFCIAKQEFSSHDLGYADLGLPESIDENSVRLRDVLGSVGAKAMYSYDFGDDWQHNLVVEKILPPADGVVYPVCKAGKRNCPPEDCGGPYGYYDLLNTFPDSEDPEYLGMIAHDPEAFSLEAVNSDLAPSPPIRSARRAPKR